MPTADSLQRTPPGPHRRRCSSAVVASGWDTYGRAIRQAKEQLEQTNKTDAPELLRAGSAEAAKFVYTQSRGMSSLSKADVEKKQLTEQQNKNRSLDRIVRKIENPGSGVEVMDLKR
jgi:hypothetical protein